MSRSLQELSEEQRGRGGQGEEKVRGKVERTSDKVAEEEAEEGAAKLSLHREPSNTNQTAAQSLRLRVKPAVHPTSPCLCPRLEPCPPIRSNPPNLTLTLTLILFLILRLYLTSPPSSTTTRTSTASHT